MTGGSSREIVIRDGERVDAFGIAACLAELGYPTDPSVVPARLERVRSAGGRALVAVRDEHVVGFVTVQLTTVVHRARDDGRITSLVVAANARGHGVGRRLVEAAEEIFRAAGCGRAEVTSGLRLPEAHAFYVHLGYEHQSVRFVKPLW